jgi:hypothetical protein
MGSQKGGVKVGGVKVVGVQGGRRQSARSQPPALERLDDRQVLGRLPSPKHIIVKA